MELADPSYVIQML